MTYQIRDVVYYKGTEHLVTPDPLEAYTAMPTFIALSTANHRGYSAVWTVVADRLFLASLNGWADGAPEPGIRSVFPTAEAPVVADWFTGVLMLQSGRLLFQSDTDPHFEVELALSLVAGRILSARKLARAQPTAQSAIILNYPVSELDGAKSHILQALTACGIRTLGDLVRMSAAEVKHMTQLDAVAMRELEAVLWSASLSFDHR